MKQCKQQTALDVMTVVTATKVSILQVLHLQ